MPVNFIKYIFGGWYCSSCGKYHSKKTQKHLKRTPGSTDAGNMVYTITYHCKVK